jgi:hypothetical protein
MWILKQIIKTTLSNLTYTTCYGKTEEPTKSASVCLCVHVCVCVCVCARKQKFTRLKRVMGKQFMQWKQFKQNYGGELKSGPHSFEGIKNWIRKIEQLQMAIPKLWEQKLQSFP